ncbi:MAG: hypothetical protein ACYC3S_16720 [Chloroflexota bacterium]
MERFVSTGLVALMAGWLALTVLSSPEPGGGAVYTVLLAILLIGYFVVGYVAGHLIVRRHNRQQALRVALPGAGILIIAEIVLYPYIPWLQAWSTLAPSLLLLGAVVAQINARNP